MGNYKFDKKKLLSIKEDFLSEHGAADHTPKKYAVWILWLIQELEKAQERIEALEHTKKPS